MFTSHEAGCRSTFTGGARGSWRRRPSPALWRAVGASLLALAAAGCGPQGESSGDGKDSAAATEVAAHAQGLTEAVEAPGAVAEGCTQETGSDGLPVEVCGPGSVKPAPAAGDAKAAPAEGEKDAAQGETYPGADASAEVVADYVTGRSVKLAASTSGAKVNAVLVWVNDRTFELHYSKLTDTSCDARGVYFRARVPGFQYPNHTNHNGCNSTVTWNNLRGSLNEPIHHLWLEVCRDNRLADNCGSSASGLNPYYPY